MIPGQHDLVLLSTNIIRSTLLLLALSLASVRAQSPIFGQCGGQNWPGPFTCATGSVCVFQNPFYSQCVPGTATTPPPTTTTGATTTPAKSTTTTVKSTTSTASVPVLTAFVKTSGTKFTLNGAPYTLVGSNAYWLPLMGSSTGYSSADLNTAFNDLSAVARPPGFNEVTNSNGGVPFFHLWSGSTATVNTAATGLGSLDNVIAAAKAHGIRLIVTLTNNWSDYGGMDIYTAQILGSGQFHDLFYTNPTIIAAFKTYVQAVVTRYANDPTTMPRCAGSNTAASSTCDTTTITTWASNISAFIKSIDKNHLVAIGDEGFFNEPGSHNFDFVYQGTLGIDFAANMQISTLDFGTFHESWGENADVETWGVQWITDHATVMASTNKPAIMEEFGITDATRNATYATWYQTVISTGVTGDLIWQAGSTLSNGQTPYDGYMIFPTDPVYQLIKSHAAALKARG
ncbi:glycoside hydrolase [Mycena pura]|uniref:mannan endo-1,4-beta-mannosidase n=1 Tax=Mycena pura TaxID=153505 RepID=A0AAD6UWM5_9AGAR|nr:glycoside hydrolase [Mycena pura]